MKQLRRFLSDPIWLCGLAVVVMVMWATLESSSFWSGLPDAEHPSSCHGCALARAELR